jgi:hypothetical protein
MKTYLLKLSPADFCEATRACAEGAAFACQRSTMSAVWDACHRADWLCWILEKIDAPSDAKAVRLYMVWCARNTPLADGRTTSALLTDPASLLALEVATRFANGTATSKELSAARSAAESAAWSAARSAAESAAWSAAWSAAESAAELATWSAAGSAAELATWSAAGSAQANEFRKVVPNPFV